MLEHSTARRSELMQCVPKRHSTQCRTSPPAGFDRTPGSLHYFISQRDGRGCLSARRSCSPQSDPLGGSDTRWDSCWTSVCLCRRIAVVSKGCWRPWRSLTGLNHFFLVRFANDISDLSFWAVGDVGRFVGRFRFLQHGGAACLNRPARRSPSQKCAPLGLAVS
jgi:hypothetical protein